MELNADFTPARITSLKTLFGGECGQRFLWKKGTSDVGPKLEMHIRHVPNAVEYKFSLIVMLLVVCGTIILLPVIISTGTTLKQIRFVPRVEIGWIQLLHAL